MAPAPLAPFLKSPKAKQLGRAPDQSAVAAFCTRPNRAGQKLRIAISYLYWSWRLYYERDADRDPKTGEMVVRRVWPSLHYWDWPGMFPGFRFDGSVPPAPLRLPWSEKWATAPTPAGMAPDAGVLVDRDPAGASGYCVLNMRRAPWWEIPFLLWKSKPWVFGEPTFNPVTDWIADGFSVHTPQTAGTFFGRGGVMWPKRKYIVTRAEIEAGIIEHAVGVTDSRIQHGPTPPATSGVKPPRAAGLDARVEHADRDPFPMNPSPAGDVPGRYPHGTTFAHTWTRSELEDMARLAGLSVTEAQTFMVIAIAMGEDEGYGWRVVDTGGGPDPLIETDGPLPGMTEALSGVLLDGVINPARMVVLNPPPLTR